MAEQLQSKLPEFSRKVTSGQITEEKQSNTNAFLWQKFSSVLLHA
jgi:hypothetical protein